MKYIISILLLAAGAVAAYFIFFRKKEDANQQPQITYNTYAYGAPQAAYDVPGPRVGDLIQPPYLGVINCIKAPCVAI